MKVKFDFESWAVDQTPEVRSAFAGITVARGLPTIGTDGIHSDFQLDLILCRAILTALVRSVFSTKSIENAAGNSAYDNANAFVAISSEEPIRELAFSAASACKAASDSTAVHNAVTFADRSSIAYSTAFMSTISAVTGGPEKMLSEPLWPPNDMPKRLRAKWVSLQMAWRSDPAMAFWIDWYEGLLEGRAPDWELWRRIAEIDNEKWESGPKAVAAEIERIKAAEWMPLAKSVIARAETLAPLAKLQAQVIEDTLTAIVKQLDSTDKVPDELEPVDRLRSKLNGLSIALSATKSEEDKAKVVAQIIREMYLTIRELNDRLNKSRSWAQRHPWKAVTISGTVAAGLGGIVTGVAMSFLGGADAEVQQVINNTYNNHIQLCTADDLTELSEIPEIVDT